MARTYTDAQKADAVAIYVEHGLAEAHRRTGIPKPTLSSWVTPEERAQISERVTAKTRAANEARVEDMAARRAQLASDLMGDVNRLRGQLFAPCVERKVVTLAGSKDEVGTWELVDIDRDQPTFTDQKAIMTTIAIAVDKIQILTGEATERVEHRSVPERTPEQEHELDTALRLVRDRAA